MMKYLVLTLLIILGGGGVAMAQAPTGYYVRTNCGSLATPVTDGAICLQTTTTDGLSAGYLYKWNGSAWAQVYPSLTAVALASNPTDCAAGGYANTIAASGNLTCDILIVSSVSDPTPDDDTGDGYIIGTMWINTTDASVFVATDVTAATAVWKQVYPVANESDTLDSVMSRGNTTIYCTDANPCQFGNGVVYVNIYCNDQNVCYTEMSEIGDTYLRARVNYRLVIYDEETSSPILTFDPDAATQRERFLFGAGFYPTRTVDFPAAALTVDGTQCAQPALATINSGAPRYTVVCQENDAASIYGEVVMPKSWDGGTVTFTHRYVQTAADTGSMLGDIAASCRLAGSTINNTWGTEVAIDDAAVTGSNAIDMTTSAAVTPNGTCTAGTSRLLQFRWQYDATSNPTTAAATLHHLGFTMEYSITSLSD